KSVCDGRWRPLLVGWWQSLLAHQCRASPHPLRSHRTFVVATDQWLAGLNRPNSPYALAFPVIQLRLPDSPDCCRQPTLDVIVLPSFAVATAIVMPNHPMGSAHSEL